MTQGTAGGRCVRDHAQGPRDEAGGAGLPRWVMPALLAAIAVLFVVTLRPGHSWHDDFALYVMHARNLAQGMPYDATGYLYNPGDPLHSPSVYPPGFPLLLAPFYAIFGANLLVLKLVVMASFIAAVGIFALLIRPLLPPRFLAATMVLVGLQPFFARFKNLLLPDYTFVLLAFASLYLLRRLYERHDTSLRTMLMGGAAGVCMAAAVSVRMVGVALFAALALYQLLQRRLPRAPVVVAGITALCLVGLQLMLMPPESGYAVQISDVANLSERTPPLHAIVLKRITDLFTSTGILWAPRDDLALGILGSIEQAFMKAMIVVTSLLALSGLILRLRRASLLETFVLAYAAVLLYWGFISSRYMIPLLPFVLFYAVVAVRFLMDRGGAAARYGVLVLVLVVAGSYTVNLVQVQRSDFMVDVLDAPSAELFGYLRSCSEDVRFAADRPRALALFTGREATSVARPQTRFPERFTELTAMMDLDYVVAFRGSRLDSAAVYTHGLSSTFENDMFAVYRIHGGEITSTCPET